MHRAARVAWILSVGCLSISSASSAQPIHVVTGAGETTTGFSSLLREGERAVQQFYDGGFFAAIAQPLRITEMSFRLPAVAGVDFPELGDMNFGRYDITLAKPSAAAAAANGLTSATFANNMLDPVLVRSGPLTIPAGSFESNAMGVDAEFSFVFAFDTPYEFTPGQDLVMLVRHDGHGDVHGVETRWNFDGYEWTGGMIVHDADADALVANFDPGDFDVSNRIRFTFVPEPGSLLLFVAALLLLPLRRRGR